LIVIPKAKQSEIPYISNLPYIPYFIGKTGKEGKRILVQDYEVKPIKAS
jgi:hypothetical protein